MWGVVNILQFIVYFHYIKVRLAAHAKLFLTKLKMIALCEFIEYEQITNKVQEMLSEKFNASFKDSSIMDDMGINFLIGSVLVLFTIIILLLGLLNKKLSASIRNKLEKVKAKLLWNAFIRYSLQSYL